MATHSAKRTRLSIALTITLLALLALIAWMEFGGTTNNKHAAQVVNTIVISRKGHDDITLVRDTSSWIMSSPYSLKANTQRIEPLLNLASLDIGAYARAEVDLPATGLTEAAASVAFDDRTYYLGNTDTGGERRYTLIDERVGFVPEWVWSLVHGGVSAFADLSVFHALPETLYLSDGHEHIKLNNSAQWNDLQADKIIAWPNELSIKSQAGASDFPEFTLRTSNNLAAGETLATITKLDDFAAISTKAGFAYAISHARLDVLLTP